MKPICVKCECFYRSLTNGVQFVENRPVPMSMRLTTDPEWIPYKLWSGDLWECKGCGHRLISGVGQFPIAIDYETHFDSLVKGALYKVNDC